jgi:hypothetical protein
MKWYEIYDMIWNIWYDMIWNIWYDMKYDIWYDIWNIWYEMIWNMIYDMICYMIWYDMKWYDMIYLLTAIGLTSGGSSTVHIYTQTIHRTTQSTQTMYRTTHLINMEECGPCPVFARDTLAFALQLTKKHRKNLSQVSRRMPAGMMKTEYTEQSIHNNKNT